MRMISRIVLMVVLLATMVQGAETTKNGLTPEEVVAGFDQRVDAMFRAESGKPLVRAKKEKPLGPGRGNFVRAYSYSMVEFAARCLYLGEMLDAANAALVENAQHYLDNPKDINDRDSFHWHAEVILRLVEMYGTNGRTHAGRLNKNAEDIVLKPIWIYAKAMSRLSRAEYKKSQTWRIYGSENHHTMGFTVCWHFAKIAKDRPEYKALKYNDGATSEELYRAWNDYFVTYCLERARKGVLIEMMNDGYNAVWLKGIYNFYDFGEPSVRHAAGLLLDLFWAYWAEEQINGVQGGGKSRIYFDKSLTHKKYGIYPIAWFNFGIGSQPRVGCANMDAALSGYRPPAVVADIALDVSGRGSYEVRQRPLGLIANVTGTDSDKFMRTDTGGILRYTYCDPAFIIGTPMTAARPLNEWATISSQNRWQGVIFAGSHIHARIIPIVRPDDNMTALNAQWSVQSKGSLIVQKLKADRGGAEMIVWMSKKGLSEPVEEDGVVFVEAEGAYAATRVSKGEYKWKELSDASKLIPENKTMVLTDKYAPVILEVMAKRNVASFDAFKSKVKSREIKWDGTVLNYHTIYDDNLTFDASYEKTPSVNGKPVNYVPQKAFDSPFLNGDWNSGVVTISKGKRSKVLNFNINTKQ